MRTISTLAIALGLASCVPSAETGDDTIAEVDFASGRDLRRLAAGDVGDGLAVVP